MSLSGNVGEWSEVYALLKLLADGKLYAGDDKLLKLEDFCYSVVRILRDDSHLSQKFTIENTSIIVEYGNERVAINQTEFILFSKKLFESLKTKLKDTSELESISDFLSSFGTTNLKAKSSKKSDLVIILNDPKSRRSFSSGYSIKSQIGSSSTLLNASKTTNITYKVLCNNVMTQTEIAELNKLELKEKIAELLRRNGTLEFVGFDNHNFDLNLKMLDCSLPKLLGTAVYLYFSTNLNILSDIVGKIEEIDPFQIGNNRIGAFYKYKFKHFLTSIAIGMMPGTEWDGRYDATGGYLIIKDDGDLVCYHLYDKNKFEDYLFNNTKFDTASTTRHEFGDFYLSNNECFIKLNMQIRFRK